MVQKTPTGKGRCTRFCQKLKGRCCMLSLIEKWKTRRRIKSCSTHHFETLYEIYELWWCIGGYCTYCCYQPEQPAPYQGIWQWKSARLRRCTKCGAIEDEISFVIDWLVAHREGNLIKKMTDGTLFQRAGNAFH